MKVGFGKKKKWVLFNPNQLSGDGVVMRQMTHQNFGVKI